MGIWSGMYSGYICMMWYVCVSCAVYRACGIVKYIWGLGLSVCMYMVCLWRICVHVVWCLYIGHVGCAMYIGFWAECACIYVCISMVWCVCRYVVLGPVAFFGPAADGGDGFRRQVVMPSASLTPWLPPCPGDRLMGLLCPRRTAPITAAQCHVPVGCTR